MTVSSKKLRHMAEISRTESKKAYTQASEMAKPIRRSPIWWIGRLLDGQSVIFEALADMKEESDA